ncbi:MAG: hypothetical protein ACPMAQ_19310, partial [Phycisphaerae bacterium]
AILGGRGTTSLSQCNFLNSVPAPTGAYRIQARGGDVTVQACRFGVDAPAIQLGRDVATAVIVGNRFTGSKRIDNGSTGHVQEGLNAVWRPAK